MASACHMARAANIATRANAGHGIAGTTVAGIAVISSGSRTAAISTATAVVRSNVVGGMTREAPRIDRAAAPVDEVRQAALIASSR